MIYTLANGCGKSRGNVNACVRPTATLAHDVALFWGDKQRDETL